MGTPTYQTSTRRTQIPHHKTPNHANSIYGHSSLLPYHDTSHPRTRTHNITTENCTYARRNPPWILVPLSAETKRVVHCQNLTTCDYGSTIAHLISLHTDQSRFARRSVSVDTSPQRILHATRTNDEISRRHMNGIVSAA